MRICKRICAIIIILALVVYVCPKYRTDGIETGAAVKKNNYIIKVKNQHIMKEIKNEYEESAVITDDWVALTEKNNIISVEIFPNEAKELRTKQGIEYIEEDIMVQAATSETDASEIRAKEPKRKVIKKNSGKYEWNVQMVTGNKVKKMKRSNKNQVKVAVLDSGIDWGNDIDLVGSYTLIPGEEEMTPLFMDGSGHGSSVASIIAAKDNEMGIKGINPDADILSIRVLDNENQAPISRVVEGIYLAIKEKADIINMSFGTLRYSEALKEAIDKAVDEGIIVVAAAGNTGTQGVEYPAALENVIAVGAIDKMGEVTSESAKGTEVDLVAPGECVRTTGFLGTEVVASGTSLSSPHVTAAISLILQRDKNVSLDFVRMLLNKTANTYGNEEDYGDGLIDIENALKNYDNFKRWYEKKGKGGVAFRKDSKEVVCFEDTGCVEGSWSKDNHKKLVPSDNVNVRAGIRFPDAREFTESNGTFTYATIGDNPWWHGSYNTNYIMAFEYATRLAEAAGSAAWSSGSCLDSASTKGYNHASAMKADVKKIPWSNSQVLGSKEATRGRKRAFIWGMAIHTATDVYAHSVFVGKHHLDHETKTENGKEVPKDQWAVADDIYTYSNRYFEDAQAVARKCMDKYNANVPGDYSVFYVNGAAGPYNYRIKDIVSFVIQAESYGAGIMFVNYNYTVSSK